MKYALIIAIAISSCTEENPLIPCSTVEQVAIPYAQAYMDDHSGILLALTDDPIQDEVDMRGYVISLGFYVFNRKDDSGFATTLPYALALPQNFETRDPIAKASLFAHEITHAEWEMSLGIDTLALHYADPSIRLAVEMVAYRVQNLARKHYGHTPEQLELHREHTVRILHEDYFLKNIISKECIEHIQSVVWSW